MKWMTAADALKPLRNGMRVFIDSGCAAPQILVAALAARGAELYDVEVVHILTFGRAEYARREWLDNFRHNAFFIGPNVREAVNEGVADYTPVSLSDVPALFRRKKIHLDIALIQVSPPDAHGFCSFGVSVDVVKAAVESADYVVAEINPRMPRTLGDSFVHISKLDAAVAGDEPILEFVPPPMSPEAAAIGGFIAPLVPDGATLQTGIGEIPNAVLAALAGKKDLGMHTEMFTEAVIPLIESGVLNCRRKTLLPGKIVASFCFGTRRLYDYIHDNPLFEFRASEFTNDPFQIARNEKMVAISSAIEVDLTGQASADSIGDKFYSGFGGQTDFMRGAARSEGGVPILALPSTTRDGGISRISARLKPGSGVVTTRADVHYVVTEFGVADLHGKSVRERALALIPIAHPRFRDELMREARERRLVHPAQIALPPGMQPYPGKYATSATFPDGLTVAFRPIQPADEALLRELFYSHSEATVRHRYLMSLRRLPREQVQRFVTLDYHNDFALIGLVRQGGQEHIVGVGRYHRPPGLASAEVAVTVHDDYQGRGIGTFLARMLKRIALEHGIHVFMASVLADNAAMMRVFRKLGAPQVRLENGVYEVRLDLAENAATPAAPDKLLPAAVPEGAAPAPATVPSEPPVAMESPAPLPEELLEEHASSHWGINE